MRGRRWLAAALPLVLLLALPPLALLLRASPASVLANLGSEDARAAIVVSLRTSGLSLAAILLFGTPLAYALAHDRLPFRRTLLALVTIPAVLPPAAAGLALLLALGRRGLVGTWLHDHGIDLGFTASAVVLAQTYVAAPFYVRPAAAAFRETPRAVLEAATLDGARPGAAFARIALPLAGRALGAGATLAWARALGEFGATALFAGNRPGETQTLPLAIYLGFETDLDQAVALSTVLLALAFGVVGGVALLRRDEKD